MEKTLEKLISNNNRGLFLLDPPTGFGKTTAVIDLIKRFLKGDPCLSSFLVCKIKFSLWFYNMPAFRADKTLCICLYVFRHLFEYIVQS